MKIHLAIDIGSESGRAIVGYLENGEIHTEEIYRFKSQFMQLRDKSYRNFYRYHEEILTALKICSEKYGDSIESIGVDSWGSDFVLLDRQGNILSLPESYRSTSKSDDIADYIEERFGAKKLYFRCGNQKMPTDTLHQLIRLKKSDSPSLDNPSGILYVADTFHYMLGAKPCCEHSLFSYSHIYNADLDDWDTEIMEAFDLPLSLRTEVSHAGDTIGYVNDRILSECGIHKPIPIVTPCSHDTACAALCVPSHSSDWAFISSGTWSLMGVETNGSVRNEKSFKYNFSNSTMPLNCNMFKKNITGTWIIQQCFKEWKCSNYDEIVDKAESAKDLDVFIDIDAQEFYSPENMPAAIAASVLRDFNYKLDTKDIGTVSRIIFESMAMKYTYYLSRLLDACDKSISRIYIIGGGSRNRLINQFTASATGYPVSIGVFEASSVGNILLQMYGCGELKDKYEMREVVMQSFPQTVFEPKEKDVWCRKYKIFEQVALKKNQW